MSIRKTLNAIVKEVVQEAEANPAFRARLEAAMGNGKREDAPKGAVRPRGAGTAPHVRSSNRRTPAILDPVHLAKEGEAALRAELRKLDLEQLRDVVADYGMDPGKLVLKWRDSERIIERIVEVSSGRAQKGRAFREQPAPMGDDQVDDVPQP